MADQVDELTPLKIIVVAKNRTWMHAYQTVRQVKGDSSGPPLAEAEFYTVDGRQLTPKVDAGRLRGLTVDGRAPDVDAVQQAVEATLAGIRKKVEGSNHPQATRAAALAELAKLSDRSLPERFDLLFALPLGHPAAAGAAHVLGSHPQRDPGNFIHMILFH